MELRHLRYFMAVAETKSFTRAAERLHISQSTLSHQIKQLESQLGADLFDRLARRADLTEAGRLFRPYCERILRELDGGVRAISELEGLIRGNLRIGVFHSFSPSPLGAVLAKFAHQHPGVHVVARLLSRAEIDRGLLDGDVDLAVAYVSGDVEHILAERLFDEELVLIVGPAHPLASRSNAPMRAVAGLDLALLTEEFAARQFVDKYFESDEPGLRIVLETNAIEPLLWVVRHTPLATVLSAGVLGNAPDLRLIRLVEPTPKLAAAILWRRESHRTPAALRMADMIREAYRDAGRFAPQASE